MVQYKPPNREYEFILREVLDVEKELTGYEGYEEATWDMIEMISDQFGKMSEEHWLPSNKDGDEIGAIFENGNVTVPPSMTELLEWFISGCTEKMLFFTGKLAPVSLLYGTLIEPE